MTANTTDSDDNYPIKITKGWLHQPILSTYLVKHRLNLISA